MHSRRTLWYPLSPCCVQGCQRPRSEPSHRSLSESRPGPAPAGMLLGWTPRWGLWELREEGAHWGALGQNCLLTSETGRGPWWGQAHPSPRLWMEAVGTVRAPTSVDLRQPGPRARLGSSHHHPAWLRRQASSQVGQGSDGGRPQGQGNQSLLPALQGGSGSKWAS